MYINQTNPDAGDSARRVPYSRRDVGRFGEDAAVGALVADGYEILRRNYRFGRYGEIDIIAQKGDNICFIEVKARSSDRFGAPAESVGWQKRRKIRTVAERFLAARSPAEPLQTRFDVVEVYVSRGADDSVEIASVKHIEDAFRDS